VTAEVIIEELRQRGVELWFEGDDLRFRAPPGALDGGMRARLAAGKSEVIAQLRAAAATRVATAPVSYNQRSLWIVQQADPHSPAYHVAFVARVLSNIDVAALRRALQALVDRHAILRTTYRMDDAGLTQCIAGHVDANLSLRALAGANDVDLDREIRADYARPFDLATGPVFRCSLFTRAPASHVLLLVVHHIAADGWSLFQMLDELRALYAEQTGGPAAALPRSRFEYKDYAAWQDQMLAGDEGRRYADYWRENLKAPRVELDLPTDRHRLPRRSGRGASHVFPLDAKLSAAARDLARGEGTTLFVVLLAAFKVLLHRLARTSDVIVGAPAFGRSNPDFATVIGDFVNIVVLRSHVDASDSFRTLLATVRETQLGALAAQEYPFPKLVEDLLPTRDPGRSPFFETFFILQRFDQLRELAPVLSTLGGDAVIDFGGLLLQHYPLDQQLGQFDLTMQCVDSGGALTAQFKFSTDLFDLATIERWSAQYIELLRRATASPSARIDELLVGDCDAAALAAFNETSVALDTSRVARQFERQVARDPLRAAVRFGDAEMSYGELNVQSNRLARFLRTLGVRPGALVGLCIERSPELLVALLAVQKSGGAYVPLDPDFPADRLAYMLEDSGARVLVTAADAGGTIAVPVGVQIVNLATQHVTIAACDAADLDPLGDPDDPAYVIYTSGSTGRPKGVTVSHGALANFLGSMAREPGLGADDVLAAVTTISFDIAALELYLPLVVGARIELIPREVSVDGAALAEVLESSAATVLQATPATWRMLVESGWRPRRALKALCGGEALPRDLADALLDRVSELWNLYGPTETTVWSTLARVAASPEPITVGRPIANTRIYVLDEARQPAPIGVPGEIWIGGAGVALGYHRRSELTAERFAADPFASENGARMYRTGDLGRWDAQGRLHHLGRLDQQVKIRGFRIELGEIEAVLATHPAVRQAVVVPREASPGDARLVAYIVFAPGDELTASDVRRHLRRELPDYMIPAAVVALDALPLTPNGKIDRKALPDPYQTALSTTEEFVEPATAAERELADIWREILGVQRVGANDNFFEIGGHSLLALRVVSLTEKRMGWRLDPRTLFFQTLRQLAAMKEGGGAVLREARP